MATQPTPPPKSSPPGDDKPSREDRIRAASVHFYRRTAKLDSVPTSRVILGHRTVWDAVAPWRGLAQQRLAEASGSAADSARWQRLLDALAEPADGNIETPTFTSLITLRATARDFFHALLEAERPGPTVAEIADRVHRAVKDGRYRPGRRLSWQVIAGECEAPTARVVLALRDLGAAGILVLSPSGRAWVPSSSAEDDHAGEIASWLTTLIEWGVYLPGSHLPRRPALARSFVSSARDVTEALRRLCSNGHLVGRAGGRPEVAERSEPPVPAESLLERLADLPTAPATPARVQEAASVTHNWWSCRTFPPSSTVRTVFESLQAMASGLLPEMTLSLSQQEQETRAVILRAAATAVAPWPGSPRGQTWRTACLGAALLEVFLLRDSEAASP
ncbi:hypothetical protein [Streptomyces sp. NPDC005012]|uniref:hypothetical protein n=1 Tax=Streptomyces sp. NPDC005012 TaxID=3154558 RepID=UPI0033A4FC9E